MKKASALAVLDYEDIPTGIYAVDAILKKAPIAFVRAGTVTHGRYLVVFGGSTGSTLESLNEAVAVTGSAILDQAFLPHIHPAPFDAGFGTRRKANGPLLVLETETASSIVRAGGTAPKGTRVELIEVPLSDAGLAGKGIALVAGTLHDTQPAADLAGQRARVSFRLIPAPHDVLERDISAATRFEVAPLLELDGEAG